MAIETIAGVLKQLKTMLFVFLNSKLVSNVVTMNVNKTRTIPVNNTFRIAHNVQSLLAEFDLKLDQNGIFQIDRKKQIF